jgi:hypothetical protein
VKSVYVDVRTEGRWNIGADIDGVGGGLEAIERMRDKGRCSEGGRGNS